MNNITFNARAGNRIVKPRAVSAVDYVLIFLFLVGIYLGVAAQLPGGVPIPCVVAGMAGLILLIKHAGDINERQFIPFITVLALYLISILFGPGEDYLREYFKGFIQLAYSLAIVYGFFIAASRFDRDRLGGMFFWFCVFIVVGTTLENYVPAFRDISDAFRRQVYSFGVYASDARDQLFYGRVRPKLFTSEPSAVTFAYTLFAFAWYVLSRNRYKVLGYIGLIMIGYFMMRGPTLILGMFLVPVYEFLLASRRGPPGAARLDSIRVVVGLLFTVLLLGATVFVGAILYQERIATIFNGGDPSFFSRIVAPLLTAHDVISRHPFSGAGLTGWEVIQRTVEQIYADAPGMQRFIVDNAAYVVTNYFWLHWIFLGLFWGSLIIGALTWFLHSLGVPSVAFCWIVWVVFGQASGGYVDPKTWTVLLMAATLAVIHDREARQEDLTKSIATKERLRGRELQKARIRQANVGLSAS
ncbi:MAG: hypothetical protein K0Q70_164 [Rhodospirillales bacterium]|nr:hypothetical protein [Rhodospirillales bacterium]